MDKNQEDIDLAELEAYINDGENYQGELKIKTKNEEVDNLEREISFISKKNSKNKKIRNKNNNKRNLKLIEETYHNPSLFYSDVIDAELDKIIPALKKKYENDDNNLDLIIYLNNKEKELLKIKSNILKSVQRGEMNQKQYYSNLKNILEKNEDKLVQAEEDNADELTEKRLKIRIENYQMEIDAIIAEVGISKTLQIINKVNPTKIEQTPKLNKNYEKKGTEIDIKNINENSNYNETINYLKSKLTILEAFFIYLQKYFKDQRNKQKKNLSDQVIELKVLIEELKETDDLMEKKEIDEKFPNLNSTDILGMSREERNDKINELKNEIKDDINEVQKENPELIHTYHTNYIPLLKKLNQIKESKFGILPELKRKVFSIPFRLANKDLDNGDFKILIKNISQYKKRKFNIIYNFSYKNNNYTRRTNFCNKNGEINDSYIFKIDKKMVRASFARTKIEFKLFKSKFFSDKFIGSVILNLKQLGTLNILKKKLEFVYKNNIKIEVNIEFSLKYALGKQMTEIELLTVNKLYPIFKPPLKNKKSVIPKKKINPPIKKKSFNKPSQVVKNNNNKIPEIKNGYKFPLILDEERLMLKKAIAENKISKYYLSFQEKVFSVTFLEEFLEELEKQSLNFSVKGDSGNSKEARRLISSTSKQLNSLSNQISSEKMSQEKYYELIEKFILIDKKTLETFQNLKLVNPVIFVNNRLKVLKGEFSQLTTILQK